MPDPGTPWNTGDDPDGAAEPLGDGSPMLLVRRFDEQRGPPVGEWFVVSLADIKRITLF